MTSKRALSLAAALLSIPIGFAGWLFAEWVGYKILFHFGWLP